jgi:SAM-dependent methyltransferase
MQLAVTELRDFYGRPLGQLVRRLLLARIRARWRRLNGETLIGLGFASPYLGAYRSEAQRIGSFMPASQGALVWPNNGPNLSVLVDEEQLPLADSSVNRLLAVHCLEVAERTRPLLREMWRVLAPEGRLLMVVPNRSGVWARLDTTPFGQGRPYSRGQLQQLLADALFTPLDWTNALYVPPIERQMVLRSATAFERVGARLSHRLGGVIIVEARKELTAPIGKGAQAKPIGGLVPARTSGMALSAQDAPSCRRDR